MIHALTNEGIFSRSSEANASERLENLGSLLATTCIVITFTMFKSLTKHWCVTLRERVNSCLSTKTLDLVLVTAS